MVDLYRNLHVIAMASCQLESSFYHPQLQRLYITGQIGETLKLWPLRNCKELTHLEIKCPPEVELTMRQMEVVSRLCKLERFVCRARLDVDHQYEFLRLLPSDHLRELTVGGDAAIEDKVPFGADFFRCLANKMPKLEQVPLLACLSAVEVRT